MERFSSVKYIGLIFLFLISDERLRLGGPCFVQLTRRDPVIFIVTDGSCFCHQGQKQASMCTDGNANGYWKWNPMQDLPGDMHGWGRFGYFFFKHLVPCHLRGVKLLRFPDYTVVAKCRQRNENTSECIWFWDSGAAVWNTSCLPAESLMTDD